MGIVTKTGLVILAVGAAAGAAGFVFAGVAVPDGTGPNIGGALLLLVSVPTAIVGATIGIVGWIVGKKAAVADRPTRGGSARL
ncbi:hypothetical protein [Arthrobacter sp.]|uniref:hypothetical protein n=1 Tax=Arthrobacter sp. TaxID=1667 RepID=UPI003A8C9528